MAIKVLVADPQVDYAKEIVNFLNNLGYETEMAINGRNAQLMMYNNHYFAIVLNLEIQEYPGTQVLKFIRTNHPSMKIILHVSSEEVLKSFELEKSSLNKVGIYDIFFHKPKLQEVQEAIEGHRDYRELLVSKSKEGTTDEVEVDLADEGFIQIKIDDFVSTKAVQFDIFIKIRPGKYIKVLHSGDTFSRERIDHYKKEKKLEHLYFLREDKVKFIRLQNFVSEKTAANANISLNTKVNVIKGLSEVYVEAVYTEGLKPLIIDQGKVLCNNVYEIVHNNDGLFKLLRDYAVFDTSLYTHSYLVMLFSSMLIKQFDWESKIINETLGMAALFHDIGCTKLAPDIKEMSFLKMNEEQLGRYVAHCELGLEVLETYPSIPQAVKQIVGQHHERINGEGFPHKIKSHRILVLAQIVGLADEFVRHMVDNQLKPPEALKKMLSDQTCVKRHSAVIMENFLKVFADPKKIASMMYSQSDVKVK